MSDTSEKVIKWTKKHLGWIGESEWNGLECLFSDSNNY